MNQGENGEVTWRIPPAGRRRGPEEVGKGPLPRRPPVRALGCHQHTRTHTGTGMTAANEKYPFMRREEDVKSRDVL